jgi:hypothetical protein
MSGAGLKKCMPTTRLRVDTRAAISVTESAGVRGEDGLRAHDASSREQRELRASVSTIA